MFRFTIRELLLMTVIVGLAIGWWIDHYHQQRLYRRSEEKVAVLTSMVKQSFELLDSYAPTWRELNRHF